MALNARRVCVSADLLWVGGRPSYCTCYTCYTTTTCYHLGLYDFSFADNMLSVIVWQGKGREGMEQGLKNIFRRKDVDAGPFIYMLRAEMEFSTSIW